jgi:hypothetical protein
VAPHSFCETRKETLGLVSAQNNNLSREFDTEEGYTQLSKFMELRPRIDGVMGKEVRTVHMTYKRMMAASS